MDTSDNTTIDNAVNAALCSMKEQCMFNAQIEYDVRRILLWLADRVVDVKTQRIKNIMNDLPRDVWISRGNKSLIIGYIDDVMADMTELSIISPDTEQWVRSCLVEMITKIDQPNDNKSNSMTVPEPRQYTAVYTRKTAGLVSIDANSLSRETVVAPSLEELKAMLEILAIGNKGFSVISVERSK